MVLRSSLRCSWMAVLASVLSCSDAQQQAGVPRVEGHGHAHGAGGEPVDPGAFEDAVVVDASADAPEFIQLASGVEVIENVAVAARSECSVFTHEGHFGPLLFGEELRAFSLRLEAGMFLAEHPHPTESIVYTLRGRWVLCSEGKRQLMPAGSLFHFGPDKPTGWEAPFAEGADILIFKKIRPGEDYRFFTAGTRKLAADLDRRLSAGETFYFHQLDPEHPAIEFARANNPDFDAILKQK